MPKRTSFACLFLFLSALAVSALDLGLCPYLQAGSGQATGSFLSDKGDLYSELGASSVTTLGSSAPYYAIPLGSVGVELTLSHGKFFLFKGPLSLALGLEGGAWGGAITGTTASGTGFATTRLTDIVVSIHADERYRFELGSSGSLTLALGPVIGFSTAYFVQENISGIYSLTTIAPASVEIAYVGVGLGVGYGLKLGPGTLSLGLHGDIGLTPLAASLGDLGGTVEFPWRALVRAGYEIPLGASKVKK